MESGSFVSRQPTEGVYMSRPLAKHENMEKIFLVSCVGKKKKSRAPAEELYTSPLFRKSRAVALAHGDKWFILSAKYGLVDPHTTIEPYDETLNSMPTSQRIAWADSVIRELRVVIKAGDQVTFLAGQRYRDRLIPFLREEGIEVKVPLEGLGIGRQLSALERAVTGRPTRPMVDEVYRLLGRLKAGLGGARILRECSGKMVWPKRGIYLFFEAGEFRHSPINVPRVVRVGTHAVSLGSSSTLWTRLRTHRGHEDSSGNHRASVFRLHVGMALLARDRASLDTWGVGQAADAAIRLRERDMEKAVSEYIGRMSLLWIDIADAAGPDSDRAFLEQNLIASLSHGGHPIDPPSQTWLGLHSPRAAIRKSGMWNIDYVEQRCHPRFLEVFERYVDATCANQIIDRSIAPTGWRQVLRDRRDPNQCQLFGSAVS